MDQQSVQMHRPISKSGLCVCSTNSHFDASGDYPFRGLVVCMDRQAKRGQVRVCSDVLSKASTWQSRAEVKSPVSLLSAVEKAKAICSLLACAAERTKGIVCGECISICSLLTRSSSSLL